jgi:hypothetical protein
MGEAAVICEGVFNSHTAAIGGHRWHSPHATLERSYQACWAISGGPVSLAVVWLGCTFSAIMLMAPCFCKKLFQCYLKICHWLCTMWFHYDGELAHFGAQAQQHLSTHFPGSWIRCGIPDCGLQDCRTWTPWTLFGDTWSNFFTGIVFAQPV